MDYKHVQLQLTQYYVHVQCGTTLLWTPLVHISVLIKEVSSFQRYVCTLKLLLGLQ